MGLWGTGSLFFFYILHTYIPRPCVHQRVASPPQFLALYLSSNTLPDDKVFRLVPPFVFTGGRAISMVFGTGLGGLLAQPADHFSSVFSTTGLFHRRAFFTRCCLVACPNPSTVVIVPWSVATISTTRRQLVPACLYGTERVIYLSVGLPLLLSNLAKPKANTPPLPTVLLYCPFGLF